MKISTETVERVFGLVGSIPGAFVVGSFLTNPDEANDIDIVIPYSVYLLVSSYTAQLSEFIATSRDDPEYDRSDIACLVQTMRDSSKEINILCVNDVYIPAYQKAVAEQLKNPEKYTDRQARVDMYDRCEKELTQWVNT